MHILTGTTSPVNYAWAIRKEVIIMKEYLANRQFRALANSDFLSAIGSVLFNLVFLIYAQTLPFKTLALSLVSIINLLPTLFMILNGYWADHTDPRRRFKLVVGLRVVQGLLYVGLAFLIRQPSTLLIFGLLLAINFSSDLIADFTSGLLLHYEKTFIKQDAYASAMGFSSGIRNVISMVFQAFGASLILVLHNNFALFGLINAISFVLAGVVLWHDRHAFTQADTNEHAKKVQAPAAPAENVKTGIFRAFALLYEEKPIFAMVFLAMGVNTLGTSMDGLTSVLLANTKALWLGTFGTTVAAVNIVGALSITLAALFMHDGLQRVPLAALTGITMGSLVVFAINMVWWQQPAVMLASMIVASYPIGKINPRLQSMIMGKIDDQHLAATSSVIDTASLVGAPLGTVLFLGIANLSSPQTAWIVFGGCAALMVIAAILCAIKWPDNEPVAA